MRGSTPRSLLSLPVRTKQSLTPRCHHLQASQNTTLAAAAIIPARRPFSSTPSRPYPKHHSKKELDPEEREHLIKKYAADFPPYTAEEKAELAKRYNPAQMAAIEAGEKAIAVEDLATQATIRRDPMELTYLEDFSRIEPTIDKKASKLRGEGQDYENADPDYARVPQDYEILEQIADAREAAEREGYWLEDPDAEIPDEIETRMENRGDGPKEYPIEPQDHIWHQDFDAAVQKAMEEDPEYTTAMADRAARLQELEREPDDQDASPGLLEQIRARAIAKVKSFKPPRQNLFSRDIVDERLDALLEDGPDVAPDIPKIDDPQVRWEADTTPEEEEDNHGLEDEALEAYQRVSKSMGISVKDMRSFRVKTLVTHRVVNQTRLGKIQSMYELAVAGNQKGLVGIGEGKAFEMDEARRQARLNAIRNMVPIKRYENRTIIGEVIGKSGAVEIKLSARQPGFGCRTSEKVFEIMRCAGIIDCQAKLMRKSRNKMNICKAVWHALRSQKDPEDIARARGKKLVDVRKVYYSGLV